MNRGSIRFWQVAAATLMLLCASACSGYGSGYSGSSTNYVPPRASPSPAPTGVSAQPISPGATASPVPTPYMP
jgi:hypothetical protein